MALCAGERTCETFSWMGEVCVCVDFVCPDCVLTVDIVWGK